MNTYLPTSTQPGHAWVPATLNMAEVTITLSAAAAAEMHRLAERDGKQDLTKSVAIDTADMPAFASEVEALRPKVDMGNRLVLVQPVPGLNSRGIALQHWALSCLLGEPLVQNSEGQRMVYIWDRDPNKRMRDGARYHQSREGGDVHTDNVNIPERWHYLLFGCIVPAVIGGTNAIVCGIAVHDHMMETVPDAVEILREEFWWEYRGISDALYQAPVLTYDDAGLPHFRYLRTYLESAHARAGQPMTDRQLWALGALDAALETPHLRLLYKLAPGEILIASDSRIFHARTCFSDPMGAIPLRDSEAGAQGPVKRTLIRTWVQRKD
jgi:hypothetical protein